MLFERRTRALRLTDAGQDLYRVTAEVLDRLRRTVARLHREPPPGMLTVTTTPGLASLWLIPRLQRLRALPNIERPGNPISMLGIAISLSRSIRAIPLALDALAGMASALLEAGAHEEAAQLARCVSTDPVSEADARAAAEVVLAAAPESRTGETLSRNSAFDRAIALSATFVPNMA